MIQKLFIKLSESRKIGQEFGCLYGIENFFSECIFRKKGKIGKKINKLQYDHIKKWLKRTYFDKVCKDNNVKDLEKNKISKNCPIWIFWWQGLETAPDLVKACISSVKKHSGEHEIIIITEANVKDYVTIPDYIYKKIEEKKITLTQFSDILRVNLLYDYGGIWLDSTIYMTKEFSSEIYTKGFYTIHHGQRADYHICKGKWTGFCMAAGKNNILFRNLKDLFNQYWKNENQLICYLLIDCFISLQYENINVVKEMIDEVPINNEKVFKLSELMNNKYSGKIKDILGCTYLNKLSNKKKIDNMKESYYQYILENRI